jgi:hypothetical protein
VPLVSRATIIDANGPARVIVEHKKPSTLVPIAVQPSGEISCAVIDPNPEVSVPGAVIGKDAQLFVAHAGHIYVQDLSGWRL